MKQLILLFVFLTTLINQSLASSLSLVEISRDDADLVYRLVIDSADHVKIDQVRKETFQKGLQVNNEILDSSCMKVFK